MEKAHARKRNREMERRDRKSNVENTVVLLSISDMSCRAQKHS